MKRRIGSFICAVLAVIIIVSTLSFAYAAGEPTTEEMEKVIKLVKPKLDIPEEAREFSWDYFAGDVYNDASWHFSWRTEDGKANYRVNCDSDGRITSFNIYKASNSEGSIIPSASKDVYKAKADSYIAKLNPEIAGHLEFENATAGSIYSKTYTYNYVRTENGYRYPDNTASVTVSYSDGSLRNYSVSYNYGVTLAKPESVIGEEKAKEILSTKQSMKLRYITDYDESGDTTVAKALLVYAPEQGYASVDAVTGEIYESVSSWTVKKDNGAGSGDSNMKFDSIEASDSTAESSDDELSEEELAQKEILEKLITKDAALKVITENKYLLVNEALSAVNAHLNKNHQTAKSHYQDDSGSYVWNVSLSNPVIDNGDYFYDYAWIDARINADNGNLVSFEASLRDRYYYEESKSELPEIKYSEEEAKKLAEDFLKSVCPDKLAAAVLSGSYEENIIAYKDAANMLDPVYGAYSFRYVRVNDGIEYTPNYINVGVDGVTGKIFSFYTRWNTNIEFEANKNTITPEKALETYIALGTDIRYETETTYIYTPVNAASKKDISKAFVYSLLANIENGGSVEAVIDKYAADIDREKLNMLINDGDEKALLSFIEEYYGVTVDTEELEKEYKDISDFYSKEEKTRLVYLVDAGNTAYIDAFDAAALNYSGEPVSETSGSYAYDDISGHWAESTITLLGEIGIGFEGGKFEPDKAITGKEFCKLAGSLSFSLWRSEKQIISLKDSDNAATRLDAIKYVLTCIDYDKVATLKNIFRTEFLDNADIKEEDIGYVAIAYALGIVKGNGETIRTYDTLTRAEALTLLTNAAAATR